MKVPILRLNRDVLIVPIHADMTDEDVLMFQTDLTEGLARTEARGVVIDVSALDIVDSFMARVLNDTARMLGLMGARVVICGVQPPVALTLVEMGRNLSTIATAFNLELALERLTVLMAQDESLAAQGRERDAAH